MVDAPLHLAVHPAARTNAMLVQHKEYLSCYFIESIKIPILRCIRAKFTANKNLTPEEILQKDKDICFYDEYVAGNPTALARFSEISMRCYQPAGAFERQFNQEVISYFKRVGTGGGAMSNRGL
jgi:hypothetical protein